MIHLESEVPWNDYFGLLGVAVYVGAYFSLQAGTIKGQGYLYPGLITVAACLVLIGLLENFNLPSTVIQVTYIAISIFGMIRFYLATRRIRFSDEERALIDSIIPNLSELESRRFLNLGSWVDKLPGTVLTREGKQVKRLAYLVRGAAQVSVSGKNISRLEPGALIGELSMVMKAPASATVTVIEPSRCFVIGCEVLEAFLACNLNVRHVLQSRMADQIGQKLVRTNAALATRS